MSRPDKKNIAGKVIHGDASETGMCLGCAKTAWNSEPLEQRRKIELWVKLRDHTGPLKLLQ